MPASFRILVLTALLGAAAQGDAEAQDDERGGPHQEACVRRVNAMRDLTDPKDTALACQIVLNPDSTGCLETVAAGLIYDGIDSSHVLACGLFRRDSSVQCLDENLQLPRPTIQDMIACSDK